MSSNSTTVYSAAPTARDRFVPVLAGLVAAVLLTASGCGEGAEGRKAVSGTVTMNGAPLNDAMIEFSPMSTDGGSFSGAAIVDGEYSIPANKGLLPGQYKVMVTMAGSAPEPELDEMPGDSSVVPVAPELIPAKYNSESTLTAQVESSGENTFDFELTR